MDSIELLREIDPAAKVAPTAEIGPYTVIGPNVTIGPKTIIGRRVTIQGHTVIGSGNHIGDGCVLGVLPQDLKFRGGETRLVIGHSNRIGRNVTMHCGTESGGWVTRLGSENSLHEGCHVAHDTFIADRCVIGRSTQLAGHTSVETGAVIGALSGLHHFVTVGRYACVGSYTPVRRDVPPFTIYGGEEGSQAQPSIRGLNEKGIHAAGLKGDEEAELRRALTDLFENETAMQSTVEQLENLGVEGEAARLCKFLQKSLEGKFGRIREAYRGKVPPEAVEHIPAELLEKIRATMSIVES
ncbi:MAG: acyl-ACP--UDP-N-acetylglucosamine O-acyltransferase [Phycisphaerales bacterium]|jgi:UDP-N-acetylglucosamine acyltransferase|nr:acyl-ACP--UDP-N-acetylglucosamine O-acyltransferase [Phycisphaerales bacterium]MBT7171171.1 acyl-ACP--UDP-N-acetylglucosamine O-acyltransferase [Phycisphaerales bacterium]